ncbi:MAG TPA: type 1 glutamine amidotransferase domain-containing protein [Pirellulales bacterium]|jgi:protease I|nr:type 1 glutamine amidotransferase domain-containing protein [Pirellulales bacterium]
MESLQGKRVAILATDGFEQSELERPQRALDDAGATTEIISIRSGDIRGWDGMDWGAQIHIDRVVGDAQASDYDALVLPGGVMNPDKLRLDKKAVRFVRDLFDAGKPVAAICHGPWTLINAGVVRGRRMTSWPSLEADLRNAGAEWVDQEVVVDNGLITSRKPADLDAFCEKLVEEIGEGVHARV